MLKQSSRFASFDYSRLTGCGVFIALLWSVMLTVSSAKADAPGPETSPARIPVPDAGAQAKSEKLIRDIFGQYLQTPGANRSAVADKMLEQGLATHDDPSARFVLLKRATELASASGDVATAMRASGETAKFYAVEIDDLRLEALRKCSIVPNSAGAVIAATLTHADEVARNGRDDVAARYLSIAEAAARGMKDATVVARVQARAVEIRSLKQEFVRAKIARDKLAKDPTDAEANATLGRFDCFVKDDWQTGLPLLAKAASPALRAAARSDLSSSNSAENAATIGDAWWDLSEKESAMSQTAMRRRAAKWYSEALAESQFTGLTRARAEKRLAAVKEANSSTIANSKGRDVLLMIANPKEEPVFQAVSDGGKFRVVHKPEGSAALAEQNVFANVNVIVWGPNRLRDTPVSALTENMQAALQRSVRDGADLIIFEQYAASNMKLIETLFGVKASGGGGVGVTGFLPAMADKLQGSGCTETSLKDVHFYNKYSRLPKDAAILLRGENDTPTAVVVPFEKGRVILIGTTFDRDDEQLNEAVMDFIYNYKVSRPAVTK
jgi:hypothetical protein